MQSQIRPRWMLHVGGCTHIMTIRSKPVNTKPRWRRRTQNGLLLSDKQDKRMCTADRLNMYGYDSATLSPPWRTRTSIYQRRKGTNSKQYNFYLTHLHKCLQKRHAYKISFDLRAFATIARIASCSSATSLHRLARSFISLVAAIP